MANQQEEEVDLISSLPDCMILEILSRLDTKYAIRTGTLSKRWQHLWPEVSSSNILFTHYHCGNIPQFYLFLKNMLFNQTTQLNKFKLHAFYTDKWTPVKKCILLAIRRNVREVDFDLDHQHFFRGGRMRIFDGFVLPGFFFTCSSFTRVSLCGCLFNAARVISWENLRTLHIEKAEIGEDMIENILSGSPVLETLELDGCNGFERIDINTNKSVKKLGLSKYGVDLKRCIQINAPHILSLEIKGNLMLDNFILQNVSSLVNFVLDIWKKSSFRPVEIQETHEEQEMNEEHLKGHLLKLAHAKEVKIAELCLETLTRLKAKGFVVPSNLKVLGEIA